MRYGKRSLRLFRSSSAGSSWTLLTITVLCVGLASTSLSAQPPVERVDGESLRTRAPHERRRLQKFEQRLTVGGAADLVVMIDQPSVDVRLCPRGCASWLRAFPVRGVGTVRVRFEGSSAGEAKLVLERPGGETAALAAGQAPLEVTAQATSDAAQAWRVRLTAASEEVSGVLHFERPGAPSVDVLPPSPSGGGEVVDFQVTGDGGIAAVFPDGSQKILLAGGGGEVRVPSPEAAANGATNMTTLKSQIPPPDPPELPADSGQEELRDWLAYLDRDLRSTVASALGPEDAALFDEDLDSLGTFRRILWSVRVVDYLLSEVGVPANGGAP